MVDSGAERLRAVLDDGNVERSESYAIRLTSARYSANRWVETTVRVRSESR